MRTPDLGQVVADVNTRVVVVEGRVVGDECRAVRKVRAGEGGLRNIVVLDRSGIEQWQVDARRLASQDISHLEDIDLVFCKAPVSLVCHGRIDDPRNDRGDAVAGSRVGDIRERNIWIEHKRSVRQNLRKDVADPVSEDPNIL